ncbi:MAG: maleylpyruvate isomerase N-terminal domain-containing protein, partial [Micromonosporaceae bacterium]
MTVDLLRHPAVAAAWDRPSALPDFRVSGLAGHLARGLTQVDKIASEPPSVQQPIPLLDHFARSDWASADRDDAVHVAIRERGETTASGGASPLADAAAAALRRLQAALPAEPADRVIELRGLWALRLDDFLMTRLLELVVHIDDLAVSAGIPTPAVPEDANAAVIELLV